MFYNFEVTSVTTVVLWLYASSWRKDPRRGPSRNRTVLQSTNCVGANRRRTRGRSSSPETQHREFPSKFRKPHQAGATPERRESQVFVVVPHVERDPIEGAVVTTFRILS
jgi:hypothetical protein